MHNLGEYRRKVELFNSLLDKNWELWQYDSDLSDLQTAVVEHLAENLCLKVENFDYDVMVFHDICSAYMGKIFILEEPAEFVPVMKTKVIKSLVLNDIPFKNFL